jgi:hypothetical protein
LRGRVGRKQDAHCCDGCADEKSPHLKIHYQVRLRRSDAGHVVDLLEHDLGEMPVIGHFEEREDVWLTPARVRLPQPFQSADRIEDFASLSRLHRHENVRGRHVITSCTRASSPSEAMHVKR